MWHKSLTTYIEGDAVYMKLKTGTPDMVVKGGGINIRVQGGVTNGVAIPCALASLL